MNEKKEISRVAKNRCCLYCRWSDRRRSRGSCCLKEEVSCLRIFGFSMIEAQNGVGARDGEMKEELQE